MDDQEIIKGIRDVLIADATLVGSLASATAVYRSGQPRIPWADGVITIAVQGDNPQTEFSGVGTWEPSLQINLYHSNPATASDMKARLDELLHIPLKRASGITTASYTIRNLRRTNAVDLGPVIEIPDNKVLTHIATTWEAKVTART